MNARYRCVVVPFLIRFALLVVACLGPMATEAGAQVPLARRPAVSHALAEGGGESYAWQVILVDGAAWGAGALVGALADASGDRRFGDVTATAWALGAAGSVALHGAHGRPAGALSALGLRVVAPPTAAVLGLGGVCLFSQIATGCAGDGSRWGFVVGSLIASAVDAALLAREPRSPTHDEWYGWQIAIIDVALLGTGVGAVAIASSSKDLDRLDTGGGAAVLPWVGGMLLAPIVHAFHGRWLPALGSFGMRSLGSGFGALAGLIGYCAATGGDEGCTNTGAGYGLLGGTILMAIVDDALLAHAPQESGSDASLVPTVVPGPGGLTVGVSGWL